MTILLRNAQGQYSALQNCLLRCNTSNPSGNHEHRLHRQSVILYFVHTLLWVSRVSELTAIISLNSVKQLIFVMVRCGVLFEVRTGFLNNI
jgi:hypothetical protein